MLKKITLLSFSILSFSLFANDKEINAELELIYNDAGSVQYLCRAGDTKKCKCDCLQAFCEDNGSWGCDASDQNGNCVAGHCVVRIP